jgi:hypothetical protein
MYVGQQNPVSRASGVAVIRTPLEAKVGPAARQNPALRQLIDIQRGVVGNAAGNILFSRAVLASVSRPPEELAGWQVVDSPYGEWENLDYSGASLDRFPREAGRRRPRVR